jgi:hypothetical protein
MSSSRGAVWCTVRDGAIWMQVDNASVKIPPQFLDKSPLLMNAMSVAQPSITQTVSLAAPTDWIEAWVLCFCDAEENLSCQDIQVLVDCLLVCFLLLQRIFHGPASRFLSG